MRLGRIDLVCTSARTFEWNLTCRHDKLFRCFLGTQEYGYQPGTKVLRTKIP